MPDEGKPQIGQGETMVYRIRIKGHLSAEWTEWFGGLSVTAQDGGVTLLSGAVIDQAALHGLLRKVRDLGMPLLSVEYVEPGLEGVAQTDAAQE